MSKKATPPAEQLLHSLLRIHVPSSYRVGAWRAMPLFKAYRKGMIQGYGTPCPYAGARNHAA
ncbi:MAG: hypothetical protein LBL33_07235 [Tannerella sp.]|nr:hypothetical protein [Tannerella sp.]